MSLKYKIFGVLLFCVVLLGYSQNDSEDEVEVENVKPNKEQAFTFSVFKPIAFGKNYVSKGMETKIGYKFSFKTEIYKGIIFGNKLYYYETEVTDASVTGVFKKSQVSGVGLGLGYRKVFGKFTAYLLIYGGISNYDNKGAKNNFTDDAWFLSINPEIAYPIISWIDILFSAEYHRDFLKIEHASERSNVFGHVDYLNISLGVQVTF